MPAKNSKYKPDETPTLIEQCAREGMTKYEIAAKLGIHRSTLYVWRGKYLDVSEALRTSRVDVKEHPEVITMGKRGRKPKPTNLKVLEGNPGKRPLPKNEPQPDPSIPECPDWLSDDAKKEWARVAPELNRLGLLTDVDRAALVGYCESWAQYKKARQWIHEHREVYPIKTESGAVKYLQQVPQVGIANQALKQIRAFCSEFGMTPSARSTMQLPGKREEVNPMEEMMRRKKRGS